MTCDFFHLYSKNKYFIEKIFCCKKLPISNNIAKFIYLPIATYHRQRKTPDDLILKIILFLSMDKNKIIILVSNTLL